VNPRSSHSQASQAVKMWRIFRFFMTGSGAIGLPQRREYVHFMNSLLLDCLIGMKDV
jgi:hypothetical protein